MNDSKWLMVRGELMELAMKYRMDWSEFDGRDLLREIEDIIKRAEEE
jgi:hypothetical protein